MIALEHVLILFKLRGYPWPLSMWILILCSSLSLALILNAEMYLPHSASAFVFAVINSLSHLLLIHLDG